MELKNNTLLRNGTYRILKKLGQGSFGITYLAEHTALGKKVAIKEFFMKDINSRSDDGSITGITDGSLSYNYGQKFKREALNLAKLEHPNIVRVTDCFDENSTYYYVMDFIEGENLNDYLKSHTVSENEAIAIIKDVASALTYMHDQHHMLHLDLKPGNIMRRASDCHIFLIDFGLSKHYNNDGQAETSTSIGSGTPGYAPIEQSNQSRGGDFRPTIDVYAMGATLYKLLTGETPPVPSDLLGDPGILTQKMNAKGISQSVINLVMEAMEPVVKNRIPTVNEFSRRLAEGNSTPLLPKKPSDYNHNRENTRFAAPYTEETRVEDNKLKDKKTRILSSFEEQLVGTYRTDGGLFTDEECTIILNATDSFKSDGTFKTIGTFTFRLEGYYISLNFQSSGEWEITGNYYLNIHTISLNYEINEKEGVFPSTNDFKDEEAFIADLISNLRQNTSEQIIAITSNYIIYFIKENNIYTYSWRLNHKNDVQYYTKEKTHLNRCALEFAFPDEGSILLQDFCFVGFPDANPNIDEAILLANLGFAENDLSSLYTRGVFMVQDASTLKEGKNALRLAAEKGSLDAKRFLETAGIGLKDKIIDKLLDWF